MSNRKVARMEEERKQNSIRIGQSDALIIVDLQNDFCPPDGALAVPQGTEIIPKINEMLTKFPLTIATQDWHPSNHYSFKQQGGNWPSHCIQDEWGSELHPDLNKDQIDHFLKKGQKPDNREDYSGFSAIDSTGRGMTQLLNTKGAARIFVVGLALDYCVKATVLQGIELGFRVFLIEECTRPVDKEKGKDTKTGIQDKGGTIVNSSNINF